MPTAARARPRDADSREGQQLLRAGVRRRRRERPPDRRAPSATRRPRDRRSSATAASPASRPRSARAATCCSPRSPRPARARRAAGDDRPRSATSSPPARCSEAPRPRPATSSARSCRALPLVVGVVLGLGFLLLLALLRAPLAAAAAVALSLLATAAAFGVARVVFQDGALDRLLGWESQGFVDAWAPIFFFALVFALAMDYTVFLLATVKAVYDRTGDARHALVEGLAGTGRVINAAAAVMVVVFMTFALAGPIAPREMGVILAVAVLLDATLIRLLLQPVVLRLLGARAWWMPAWLDRLVPSVGPSTRGPSRSRRPDSPAAAHAGSVAGRNGVPPARPDGGARRRHAAGARRAQAAGAAGAAARVAQPHGRGRPPRRRPLGRGRARLGGEDGPDLRLAAAQGPAGRRAR